MDRKHTELMVTIRCLAYNHEPYIRQCLDGFVMQKTNFRFEAIVHDDASTDGTADIIREYAEKYPDIIKPIFETENQYSKRDGSIRRIMNEHTHGKYVAMCEGDDYWIDPLKLQKQVDILNSDEQIGLCYTKAKKFNQTSGKFDTDLCGLEYKGFSQMLRENPVVTLTTMYRRNLYDKYIKDVNPYTKFWKMGDYPLWLWIAAHYKVKYLSDVTGVYRVLLNSASHSASREKHLQFILSSYEIKVYFAREYLPKCSKEIVNKKYYYESLLLAYKNYYIKSLKLFFRVKNKSLFDCARFIKHLICK